MLDFPIEKTEHHYYATVLVWGKRSPKVRDISAYSLDIFREEKDLVFGEYSALDTNNAREIVRHLTLGDSRQIETSYTDMRSEVNKVVTYIDPENRIHISDTLFSDEEFESLDEDWDRNVCSKIKHLGILIYCLHKKDIQPMPLFVNEFPNIMKVVLERPELWGVKNE